MAEVRFLLSSQAFTRGRRVFSGAVATLAMTLGLSVWGRTSVPLRGRVVRSAGCSDLSCQLKAGLSVFQAMRQSYLKEITS